MQAATFLRHSSADSLMSISSRPDAHFGQRSVTLPKERRGASAAPERRAGGRLPETRLPGGYLPETQKPGLRFLEIPGDPVIKSRETRRPSRLQAPGGARCSRGTLFCCRRRGRSARPPPEQNSQALRRMMGKCRVPSGGATPKATEKAEQPNDNEI